MTTPTCSICTSKCHYDLECPEKPTTASGLLQLFVSHPFMADLPEGDMLRLSKTLKDAFTEMSKPGKKVSSHQVWTPEIALVVDDTHYQINRYERICYIGPHAHDYIIDGFRCVGDIMTALKHPIHLESQSSIGSYINKILMIHGQPNQIIISSKHISPVIFTYSERAKKWAERDKMEIKYRNEYITIADNPSDETDDCCWRGDYNYPRFIHEIQLALIPDN